VALRCYPIHAWLDLPNPAGAAVFSFACRPSL